MQCQCGSEASVTRLVKNKLHAELEFHSCSRCGRVSNATLSIRGVQVSHDLPGEPVARRQFESLTASSAEQLHETALILYAGLEGRAGAPLTEQSPLF